MTSGDSPTPSDAFLDKLGKARRALAIIDIAMLRFGSRMAAFLLDCGGDRRRDLVGRRAGGPRRL